VPPVLCRKESIRPYMTWASSKWFISLEEEGIENLSIDKELVPYRPDPEALSVRIDVGQQDEKMISPI